MKESQNQSFKPHLNAEEFNSNNSNELNSIKSSRIAGFANMSPIKRSQALLANNLVPKSEIDNINNFGALTQPFADKFIENCIGGYTLPLGIATNFRIDDQEVIIPMAVEESSVIAAASYGAKLARSCGGFTSETTKPITTCQIQFNSHPKMNVADIFYSTAKNDLIQIANQFNKKLVDRGGGVQNIELRMLSKPGMYVIHIHVDTREAMGANIVNAIAEHIGNLLPNFIPCTVGSKILTNLSLHRITKVTCEVEFQALERENLSGQEVAKRICKVWEFADIDPFRAVTHNKGIMNGIDPVVIATGNDWRAVEAGCHAYASISGSYKPLTKWFINNKQRLQGEIQVPIAVGTVGGVTRLHPTASTCLKLMGSPKSAQLSAIIASVGLAQNLSAIRALGCEGIQKGHMALHEKNLDMMRVYDHLPNISVIKNEE